MLVSVLFTLLTAIGAQASPWGRGIDDPNYNPSLYNSSIPYIRDVVPGNYVKDISQCPKLTRRPIPDNAHDVRLDDITVVMALGDSVTAAMFAKAKNPLQLLEYRGVSYATGRDPGALTLANFMNNYTPNVGGSTGAHLVTLCAAGGPLCTPHWGLTDGLNSAISGAHASNLPFEASSWIVPKYKNLAKADGWAFLNIMIGPNDMCQYCAAADFGIGNSQEYASGIRDAVQQIRAVVPRLIVNVIGTFHVSDIYAKTVTSSYCWNPLFPIVPHPPIECPCASFPGAIGDIKRSKMDTLASQYDDAIRTVVRGWQAENDPHFGVTFQPGSLVNIKNSPLTALSPADCFHPSLESHKRFAAGVWNRMATTQDKRDIETKWENDVWIRCVEESDRIQLNQI